MSHTVHTGFFTLHRMARLILAVMFMNVVLAPAPASWAAGSSSYSGTHFGAGNFPAGCAGDMVTGTPEYWYVAGEGGLTGSGTSSSQAVCHHMRTDMNFLDSPEIDVLILVPLTAEVEREMRQARQSIEMWEQGIDFLAADMGMQWLADGMNFHVTVDYIDPNGEGGEFTTYPIVDPELVIVQGINPVGHVGIGIDPVGTFVTGDDDLCGGIANPLDIDAWENLPGFDDHHEGRGGIYNESCEGSGGNICFAVNSRMPSAFGAEAMFDLVSHEVGHCLSIGHVGDGAEGAWGGLAPDDIMAYDEGGAGAKCVSTLDVEGLALRMSRFLDVNGDGEVTAADELKANDQTGQGGNPFQVQHPRDHYYATSTGAAIDCPQPDMGLVPGPRTSWTPTKAAVNTTPELKITAPLDGAESTSPTFTVTGSVDHVAEEVQGPTESEATITDAQGDSSTAVTDILGVDFAVTATSVIATIDVAALPPTVAVTPTSYSLEIDGRVIDTFYYGNATPRVWDNGAGAYLTDAQGISVWDAAASTVTLTISRAYLSGASLTPPHALAARANVGGVGSTSQDDRAPNGNDAVALVAPTSTSSSMSFGPLGGLVGDKAAVVVFDNGDEPSNTFFTEQSTAGLTPEAGVDGSDLFSLDVAEPSDVEFTLTWTDAIGGTDLDLHVSGAADSGTEGASADPVETFILEDVTGHLDIRVEPYLVVDALEGTTYTLTADVRPLGDGPDADGDGFADAVDNCPQTPGTAQGCPDGDGDGVADGDDTCPTIAGNGADGCPISATEQVVVYVDDVQAGSDDVDTLNGVDAFSVDVVVTEGTHELRIEWVDEGVVLATATRSVTYIDDGLNLPTVSASPDTVEEAGGATLDVVLRLSAAAADDVVVTVATNTDGTATPGVDFTPVERTLTFTPGETVRTFAIPVLDDEEAEATETVNVDVTSLTDGVTFNSGATSMVVVNRITDVDDQVAPDADVAVTFIDGKSPTERIFVNANEPFAVTGTAEVPTSGGGGGGGGDGDLIADAGNSQHVSAGQDAPLLATAFGGQGDITFAWSHNGDTARFDDASAMATTFDTTGLSGVIELTVTVTDSEDGSSDSDTVLLSVHNGGQMTLVDEAGTFTPEFLSLANGQVEFPFAVATGSQDLTMELAFSDASGLADLDLEVDDPSNVEDGNQDGYTSNNPETIVISAPATGTWKALVSGFISTLTDYQLTVTANVPAPDPRPVVDLPVAYDFAAGATQTLAGSVTGGLDPVLLEWDLDNDGVSDGTGATITSTFGQGQHLVSLKATGADGFEHRVITAVRVGNVVSTDAPSLVVVSVVDTGINAYHRDFGVAAFPDQDILALTNNFTRHPSEYIAGYPASSTALNLTLGQGYFPAADQATINGIELGKLYWIPGTKIIGARDDGSATGIDTVKLLDEDGHGTASASVAVGNIYGFCPSCLLAVGEGFNTSTVVENEDFYNSARWVDITSNSFGPQANVAFGPLTTSPVPKASAEAGQIHMYAAGNGAANAFVVPVQTYLPPSLGPDWIVRVGAANSTTRKPIVGDGNPVDISSFGSGPIQAAGIGSTNGIGSHSGTSSATPKSAGALGLVLRAARTAMGDTTVGWANGVVASGTAAGTGALADGSLTRAELLEAFFKTAEHDQGGSFSPFSTTTPYTPLQYLFEGYGIADPASAGRAISVLMGDTPMPDRALEDQFFREFDEPVRDFLYGGYDESADPDNGGESSTGLFSSSAVQADLLATLATGSLDAMIAWWTSNIGELPMTATAGGLGEGETLDGSVQVAIAPTGQAPTDWNTVTDTSDGDLSTWTVDTSALDAGDWDIHARVLATDGEVVATDGPFTVRSLIPFDPTCPVYNTRLGDDLAGDAIVLDVQAPEVSTPSLDVLAVDAHTLADGSVEWVLSVNDIGAAYDGAGERWTVAFQLGADVFELDAERSAIAALNFGIAKNGATAVLIGGSLDTDANEVRWIVPTTIYGGAHADALAIGQQVDFTAAGGWRNIGAGTLRADNMDANGCTFRVGQDIRVPAVASIEDASASEDGSSVSLTISLDRPAVDGETILVSTTDGTATAGEDYVALVDQVITFADGEYETTFSVDLQDDANYEGDEQFNVILTAGHDTTTDATSTAVVTILENDSPPVLTAAAATVEEAAGATLDVVLTLSAPAVGDVTFTAATVQDGADQATPGSDYTAVDEQVTIADGTDMVTIQIAVLDDEEMEGLEHVLLDLGSLSSNATFDDGVDTLRVVNAITDEADQVQPTVTLTGSTIDEPAVGGSADLTWTVTVEGAVRQDVVVDLAITGGTATAADHAGVLSAAQLTFSAPGTQVVTLAVNGDDEFEGDETVEVSILEGTPSYGTVTSERTAVGTIVDTTPQAAPAASITDAQVVEGDGGEQTMIFHVTLDRPATEAVELLASTQEGTATDKDFNGRTNATILIAAGQQTAQFHVAVRSDKKVEADETFTVTITAVTGATVADGEAIGTILDDDVPSAKIKGFSISEKAAGQMGPIEVEITLDQAPMREARVWVSTIDGGKKAPATAGEDYLAVGEWVTFAPGQKVASFFVTILEDEVDEDKETFTIQLSQPEGLELKNDGALVTIKD